MPTAPVAAGSLITGYGVARGTGVRPVGGAVFLAGTAWCARTWARQRGAPVAALLVGAQAGAFVASHKLARRLGAWPSVLAVAAGSAALAAVLADMQPQG